MKRDVYKKSLPGTDPNLDLGGGLGSRRWWRNLMSLIGLIAGAYLIGTWSPYYIETISLPLEKKAEDERAPTDRIATKATATTSAPDIDIITTALRNGDTLADLLKRHNIDAQTRAKVARALSKEVSPKKLRPKQKITLQLTPMDKTAHELTTFIIKTDFGEEVHVNKNTEGDFKATRHEMAIESRPVYRTGIISDSLYLSGERAAIPAPILIELIRIYSFSVDFQREIRKGDGFRVLYEELRAEDGETTYGNIDFAELTLRGDKNALYRFTPSDDNNTDYFNAKGQSTRRLLMKTPIDGARLSSSFGSRRHPVLGYVRSHKGADFAAPTGTPIYAAGNGVVERASRYGSFGNYIRLRHNGTYKTVYAHLSKYGRGIRKGRRVKQGQVIGYVGATGRVTGAHLHYEVHQNGKAVNPVTLKLPSGRNLTGAVLKDFKGHARSIDFILDEDQITESAHARSVATAE